MKPIGKYRLVSTCGGTISDQTITEFYNEKAGVTTIAVQKETKNNEGDSVKLKGSTIKFKEGYPPLLFDAGIFKIKGKTITSFTTFLPTVTSEEHIRIFDSDTKKALMDKGITSFSVRDIASLPDYFKTLPEFMRRVGFTLEKEGEHLELLEQLRRIAEGSYEKVLNSSPSPCPTRDSSSQIILKCCSARISVGAINAPW